MRQLQERKSRSPGEVNLVTNSDNACYKIQIYTDLTDPYDPESGTAAYAAPYEFEQPIAGVQTISVPEVVLKQGSRYSVVITNSGIEKSALEWKQSPVMGTGLPVRRG